MHISKLDLICGKDASLLADDTGMNDTNLESDSFVAS